MTRMWRAFAARRTAVAVPIVGALLLTACGGGGDNQAEIDEQAEAMEGEQAGSNEGSGESVELSFSSWVQEESPFAQSMIWWGDEIEERTDGRVTVEYFWAETLCPPDEQLVCVSDGRSDVAHVSTAWHPGDFPLTQISEVPFLAEVSPAGAQALNSLYDEYEEMRAEFEEYNVTVLNFNPVGEAVVGVTSPIESLSDVEGMGLRTVARLTDAFEMVGADPVSITTGEMYEALERGVMDGWVSTLDIGVGAQLHEVTDYWYDFGTGLWTTTPSVINNDVLDQMSDQDRETVLQVGREMGERYWNEWQVPIAERDCQTAMENLETAEVMPDDVIDEFRSEVAEPLQQQWREAAADSLGGEDAAEEFAQHYIDSHDEIAADIDDYQTAMDICSSVAG